MSVVINGSTGGISKSGGGNLVFESYVTTSSGVTIDATKLAGAVPATSLNSADGSGLTNIDAANISSGTLNGSRLPSNVPQVTPGSANEVLTSDGTNWTSAAASGGGLASVQVFTASGTWTKPSGINLVRVQLVGSGAGGRNWGPAGGAGGYSEKLIDVSSIASETVTVGAAPTGQTAGNTSSFGSHLSATGGAAPSGTGNGGLGGTGTGGDINIDGGGGWTSGNTSPYNSNSGGISYFGGGGAATQTGPTSPVNVTNGAWGAGGGSTHNGYTAMPNPRSGIVIVWEFK